MTVRLSVNINDETMEFLKERAKRKGTSVTEQVRQVSSIAAFVDLQFAEGRGIQTVEADGKVSNWVML